MVLYVEPLQPIFKTAPLGMDEWTIVLFFRCPRLAGRYHEQHLGRYSQKKDDQVKFETDVALTKTDTGNMLFSNPNFFSKIKGYKAVFATTGIDC